MKTLKCALIGCDHRLGVYPDNAYHCVSCDHATDSVVEAIQYDDRGVRLIAWAMFGSSILSISSLLCWGWVKGYLYGIY